MKVIKIDVHHEKCGNCGTCVTYPKALPGTYTEMGGATTPNWITVVNKECAKCGMKVDRGQQ